MFVGLVLVAVGILWLLTKLGILSGSLWDYFWPIIVITIGLSIIWRRRTWRMGGWRPRRWPRDQEPKQ